MKAQQAFMALAEAVCCERAPNEEIFLRLAGEDSDFVRVSQSRIRQSGHVTQQRLSVALVLGSRQAESGIDLGGDLTEDLERTREAIGGLRKLLPLLPEDPYLHWHRSDDQHVRCDLNQLPSATVAVAEALSAAAGLDLVGIWASGAIHAGFASSHGQRAWHSAFAWSFDWSVHRSDGQAIKGLQAGTTWNPDAWRAVMDQTRINVLRFDRPRRRIEPGTYRVFLEPAAVQDIVGLLCWGGFSARSRRTRTSPLLRLETGQAQLSPLVSLSEDAAVGLAPMVTDCGFRRADGVTLIDQGRCGEALISARTAKEYALSVNAGSEAPASLRMAPGNLRSADALAALGTGLWLGNVHYLNYSDRSACRITGMTRFACWWVEGGIPVAPIEHLRFDDTIFNLLGDGLEALTCERELIPETGTYDGRSLNTAEVPGALIRAMRFTL